MITSLQLQPKTPKASVSFSRSPSLDPSSSAATAAAGNDQAAEVGHSPGMNGVSEASPESPAVKQAASAIAAVAADVAAGLQKETEAATTAAVAAVPVTDQ